MFESNIPETTLLNSYGLDWSQGAIATFPPLGEDTMSNQQYQLLGSGFTEDYLRRALSEFLQEQNNLECLPKINKVTNYRNISQNRDSLTGNIISQPMGENFLYQQVTMEEAQSPDLDISNISVFDTLTAGFYADFSNTINNNPNMAEDNNIASVVHPFNPFADGYSIQSGYGLIDAAAAVAQAINQPTFGDFPNLGGNNWGADLVNAPEVWNAGYTGEGVVVAVLDTGVDRNHEDLKDNIWTNADEIAYNGIDDDGNGYVDDVYGWNFYSNNNNTIDVSSHGTHISGTIAGANNGLGVTGVAYNAQIMPVKVLGDDGQGWDFSVLQGIYYAVDNGADVINLSLGSGYWNATFLRYFYETHYGAALKYASDNNVIVVMSAGNSGLNWVANYPAAIAHTWGLAVGAVDYNNQIVPFSNLAGGYKLAYVTAPGVNVLSTTPNNSYGYKSGTSMSAPYVTGVVALMLEANPNLTDAQVRQIVTSTAGNSQFT